MWEGKARKNLLLGESTEAGEQCKEFLSVICSIMMCSDSKEHIMSYLVTVKAGAAYWLLNGRSWDWYWPPLAITQRLEVKTQRLPESRDKGWSILSDIISVPRSRNTCHPWAFFYVSQYQSLFHLSLLAIRSYESLLQYSWKQIPTALLKRYSVFLSIVPWCYLGNRN